jgi:hypothetical protein
MSKEKTTKKISPSKPIVSGIPGVDNSLIIPSHPIAIKENSYKPSKRKK